MAGKKGRSGRKKGSKNYEKTRAGTIINKYGVKFTKREQEEYRKTVQQANYIRQKRIKELPPVAQNAYKEFGKQSDFFYRKKTLSMHQFQSKREFNRYMKSLRNMSTGKWLTKKQRVYQESYKEKVRRTFAIENPNANKKHQGKYIHTAESLELIKLINKLDPEDFAKLVENEEIDPLGEWYKGDDHYGKYIKVKAQLERAIK